MATYNELLQNFVNKDEAELVRIAQAAVVKLIPICEAVDPDTKGVVMMSSIILSAVAADGKLTAKENQFLKTVMHFDDEVVLNMVMSYDGKMVELVNRLADANRDVKLDILTLVLCVAASDEKISREENALIRLLLE